MAPVGNGESIVRSIGEAHMRIRPSILVAALVAALSTAFVAAAADDKSAPGTKPAAESKAADTGSKDKASEDKPPAQKTSKKKKGHDHSSFHKSGTETPEASESTGEPKKPAHDHSKANKSQ
jgi:hypothetical protein